MPAKVILRTPKKLPDQANSSFLGAVRLIQYLGRELVLGFAVGGVQEDSVRPHKALQVLVAHEMLAEAHVPAVDVLSPV